jgi:hypothetical protein
MNPTVFNSHAICNSWFRSLLASADEAHLPIRAQLLDEFDKYSLWADNVGAIHPQSSSLDHRLRYASAYRQEVIRILEILAEQLSDQNVWLNDASDAPENLESENSSTSSSNSDSLWDVSSDSEPEPEPAKSPQSSLGPATPDQKPCWRRRATPSNVCSPSLSGNQHLWTVCKTELPKTESHRRIPSMISDMFGTNFASLISQSGSDWEV